jgi:hypothetical protein
MAPHFGMPFTLLALSRAEGSVAEGRPDVWLTLRPPPVTDH